jgi:hypothetical protein
MSYIRGQERMVYQAVHDYLHAQLDALGWFSATPPFNATSPVTLLEYIPDKTGPAQPNTVAFTSGVEEDSDGELGNAGGGLHLTEYVFFIDIYGESQGVAKALASDVKAILSGRLPGSSRYHQLTDYSQSPPAPAEGHVFHFEHIEVHRPAGQEFKRNWEVVKVTVIHEYNAVEGG